MTWSDCFEPDAIPNAERALAASFAELERDILSLMDDIGAELARTREAYESCHPACS